MSDFRVRVGDRELPATWTDDAPETVEAIDDELPLSGDATRWGDELYFDVPVDVPAENARERCRSGRSPTGRAGTRSVCSGDRRPPARTGSRAPRAR
nr:cyclophilin-like family protein [Halobellus captivus]